jgi:hypothetical protein
MSNTGAGFKKLLKRNYSHNPLEFRYGAFKPILILQI